MADDPALRIFPDEFVPSVQASDAYKRWSKSSPGDLARWKSFRDALLAGGAPTVPSMSTHFGKALIAAGKEHMTITRLVGAATPPYPPPPPPAGNEPPPIAGQGYSLSFSDEFDAALDLGSQNKWSNGIWYASPKPGSERIFLDNGALQLVSRTDLEPHHVEVTTLHHTGVGGQSFLYGYFEARFKWPNIASAWPAFWLLSTKDRYGQNASSPPTSWVSELDIFEGYASSYGPNIFTGTLHKNTGGGFGVPDEARGVVQNVGDMTTGFHTYGCLWTPTQVAWYFDNVQLASVAPFESTPQEMFLILGMTRESGYTPGATQMRLEVDWVRVWQQ